jgi:hypothetical protein
VVWCLYLEAAGLVGADTVPNRDRAARLAEGEDEAEHEGNDSMSYIDLRT